MCHQQIYRCILNLRNIINKVCLFFSSYNSHTYLIFCLTTCTTCCQYRWFCVGFRNFISVVSIIILIIFVSIVVYVILIYINARLSTQLLPYHAIRAMFYCVMVRNSSGVTMLLLLIRYHCRFQCNTFNLSPGRSPQYL